MQFKYSARESTKSPEDFALDDLFHIERWMCNNCGLVFDFQFESGADETPGRGWPTIGTIYNWRENEKGEPDIEELGYKESCPRCGQDLNEDLLVPIRVSPMKSLSDLSSLIEQGEGLDLEFKASWPEDAHKVQKEIASFATTQGGSILFGVNDEGEVVGYQGIDTPQGKDQFQQRVRGCRSAIKPTVKILIDFFTGETGLVVAKVTVPKGPSKIYTLYGKVYIRDCEESRVATPEEIKWLCK